MTSAKILLAEDDEIMRVTLSDRLQQNGWQVDEACDGLEALDKLRANSYQIVVSDVRMPRAGGLVLLDEIRQNGLAIHIIFMSAYGTESDKAECLKKGASAYLIKPFEMDDLVHRIRLLLNKTENHFQKSH